MSSRSNLKCQSARLYRIAEHVRKRAAALKGLDATQRFVPWEAQADAEVQIEKDLADLAKWLDHCSTVLRFRRELGEIPPDPERNLYFGL
jgi:hypothetical protein